VKGISKVLKMNFKEKVQGFCKRHLTATVALMALVTVLLCFVRPAYATDDMSESITAWMPTIIGFAMLGMMMGYMKKMGR
jgi:hypothetical protein